jgi:hypothetical protein
MDIVKDRSRGNGLGSSGVVFGQAADSSEGGDKTPNSIKCGGILD